MLLTLDFLNSSVPKYVRFRLEVDINMRWIVQKAMENQYLNRSKFFFFGIL